MSDLLQWKTEKIKQFIDNFFTGITTRPRMWGTIEQIEDAFYYLDYIDLVLMYGDIDYRELSWNAFLQDKGGYGPRSAAYTIRERKSDDPDGELNKLREEYLQWRGRKIQQFGYLLTPHSPNQLSIP